MSDEVILSEEDGVLSLHLGNNVIQSSMALKEPSRLVLSYSQAMLASLLFSEKFTSVVHLGLGGGSLIRWFDKFFPDSEQIAVEINPQIIGIAQSMFGLNELQQPIDIVLEDAFLWLPQQEDNQFDLIFVDIFDANGMLPQFVSVEFFNYCLEKLSQQGIVIFNWWQGYPHYSKNLQDLKLVFRNQVITCPATTHGNIAVMAFKNKIPTISIKILKQKAHTLTQNTNIDFIELTFLLQSK